MKGLEYDHSWVPDLHWLEVSEYHEGWVALLRYRPNEQSTWERELHNEPIMKESRTKPNWLGVSKTTTKQVVDVLDLKEKDIIAAFNRLRERYFIGLEKKNVESERHRKRQEVYQNYTGRLGSN